MGIALQSPGDVATGEVISKDGDPLVQINKAPCNKVSEMVTFVQPVKRTTLNKTEICPKGSAHVGKKYKLEEVKQLAPPSPIASPTPLSSPSKSR